MDPQHDATQAIGQQDQQQQPDTAQNVLQPTIQPVPAHTQTAPLPQEAPQATVPIPPALPQLPFLQQQQQQQQPSMTAYPIITDPALLSQLSGIPLKTLLAPNSHGMILAAQQLVVRNMMQHRLLATQIAQGGIPGMPFLGATPGVLNPLQMLILQQQQQQQLQLQLQQQKAGATTKSTKSKARGGKSKSTATPGLVSVTSLLPNQRPYDPNNKQDPGGKVLWVKLSNYPWWPAKTLDETKDCSYPLHADPPRPTSFAVRFFGTYEFSWVGSKRQVTEWQEGLKKEYPKECSLESFDAAVEEATKYLNEKVLPESFYIPPEGESSSRKGKPRRSSKGGTGVATTAATAASPAAAQHPAPVDRKALVQQRKKQRLLDFGLLPPEDSPYMMGRIAENGSLVQLAKEEKWDEMHAEVMQEARKEAGGNRASS